MDRFATFIATTGGAGLARKAPGTMGTLVGVGAFLFAMAELPLIPQLRVFGIVFLLGLWATYRFQKMHNTHDDQRIVIDELLGVWVALLGIPIVLEFSWATFLTVGVAFGLFRLFDIFKPFPVNFLDRKLPGPWGVIMDDIMAGIYANAILQFSLHYLEIA